MFNVKTSTIHIIENSKVYNLFRTIEEELLEELPEIVNIISEDIDNHNKLYVNLDELSPELCNIMEFDYLNKEEKDMLQYLYDNFNTKDVFWVFPDFIGYE